MNKKELEECYKQLSETEAKLYDFIKENGETRMYDIINHEDKRLVGAIGKLKSRDLIKITKKTITEEPLREYRKIVVIVKEEEDSPVDVDEMRQKADILIEENEKNA